MNVKNKRRFTEHNFENILNRKMVIGLVSVGLSLLLMIQQADISAQQIATNGSLNATANSTALNDTNSTSSNATNTTAVRSAFDQLKDTFGSLFGK